MIVPVSCPVPNRAPGAPKLSGAAKIRILPGTRAHQIYQHEEIEEQYFCYYEVNPQYVPQFEASGLRISGVGSKGQPRIFELPGHRYFFATLFQPMLSSEPGKPHPVIVSFVQAAAAYRAAPRTASVS